MSESEPFLFLFISLKKDKNFPINFNVDIPPYITRISSVLKDWTRKQQTRSASKDIPPNITRLASGLEDRTTKQHTRYPSEDIPPYITRISSVLENRTTKQQTRPPSEGILVFSCLKAKIPGSNPDRRKSYLFYTSTSSAAGSTHPSIQWAMDVIIPEQSILGKRFPAYLHLFPNLRMSNSTPPVYCYSL